ncbi:hypothetical protein K435DRAFT_818414 [Dendrothele bispora CBS 962.96]|uniref:DUF6589 domain-containing protein n=1 Tax=Dendrothele bispora (strain CBS 962.96) TaxID=1314807 RepID=A0A4S8MDA2_DENBC|nr:hypothetical protein K435DRAFT_818414 [Dendrothele bispora CBS 962.96]
MSILNPSPDKIGTEEEKAKWEKRKEGEADLKRRQDTLEAQRVLMNITKPKEEGGLGFESLQYFVECLFDSDRGNSFFNGYLTRFCNNHGAVIASAIFDRSEKAFQEYLHGPFGNRIQKEGEAIQKLCTRKPGTKKHELLENFSLERLQAEIENCAPTLWQILTKACEARDVNTRRSKELVFITMCAMISITRSQKANDFQIVVGLFLLGSGASKREMEVLAHAGLSVSYSSVIDHIKTLSQENHSIFQNVIKQLMCSVVWDNINFAFRVESQRLTSKNHFDSGTSASLVVQYDPETKQNAKHGIAPISMKLERTTSKPKVDKSTCESLLLPSGDQVQILEQCLQWQIKKIAIDHKPEFSHLKKHLPGCLRVDPIDVHTTEHFPLPAMHIDESSLDGTIEVFEKIMEHLRLTDDTLEKHGILFTDGDLLTDSLVDKMESARRNSSGAIKGMKAPVRRFGLFHCKMAGARMVVNEHWGRPNSKWPGGLWWEHTQLLKRTPISAGWQTKKAAPWKQSHELIHMSLAAHILDGFRIYCGQNDFNAWAKVSTAEEFDTVAQDVYNNLFTTTAYNKQCDTLKPDTVLKNNILYNRDALLYWLLVTSIKAGDIGRVVLVLRIWMVMMRTPKTMPRKLFLHNWLVNISGKANSFKEIDLLQEHQNFWLKVIYTAKGVNQSWEWLSMISVLEEPVRDLLEEGSRYANKKSAFAKYRSDDFIIEKAGFLSTGINSEAVEHADDDLDEESLHSGTSSTSRHETGPSSNTFLLH